MSPGRPAGAGATPTAGTRRRRVDPRGRQALFSGGPAAARDQLGPGAPAEGRHALFASGPRRSGTVLVCCSACESRVRLELADLAVRLLSGSWWLPGRRHSRWMRCPACERHTWCQVRWTA